MQRGRRARGRGSRAAVPDLPQLVAELQGEGLLVQLGPRQRLAVRRTELCRRAGAEECGGGRHLAEGQAGGSASATCLQVRSSVSMRPLLRDLGPSLPHRGKRLFGWFAGCQPARIVSWRGNAACAPSERAPKQPRRRWQAAPAHQRPKRPASCTAHPPASAPSALSPRPEGDSPSPHSWAAAPVAPAPAGRPCVAGGPPLKSCNCSACCCHPLRNGPSCSTWVRCSAAQRGNAAHLAAQDQKPAHGGQQEGGLGGRLRVGTGREGKGQQHSVASMSSALGSMHAACMRWRALAAQGWKGAARRMK